MRAAVLRCLFLGRSRNFALTLNAWPHIPPLTTIPQQSHASSLHGEDGASRATPSLRHLREDVRPLRRRVSPGGEMPGLHPFLRTGEVTRAPSEQHGREGTRFTNL